MTPPEEPQNTEAGVTGALAFAPQPGWHAQHIRPEMELFASFSEELPFPATIVVTANPFTGSIAEFSQKALTGLAETLTDLQVIDIGGWDRHPDPSRHDETIGEIETPDALTRRMIEYLHRAPNGRLISGVEQLFLDQGWAIQITTTCAIQDRILHAEPFEQMARSVEVLRPAPAPDGSDEPSKAPVIDPVASSALGVEIETLAPWSTPTPLARRGKFISIPTLEVLGSTDLEDPKNLTRRFLRPKALTDAVLAELREHDLVNDDGLTATGAFYSQAMQASDLIADAVAYSPDGAFTFKAALVDDLVLLISEQGFAQSRGFSSWRAPSRDHLLTEVIPLSELSARLVEWLGIGPSWSLKVHPIYSPERLIHERISDNTVAPPAEADAAMERLWSSPWWRWQLRMFTSTGSLPDLSYLSAAEAGIYMPELLDHEVEGLHLVLLPLSPGMVLLQIEDRIQALLFERDPLLS